jgi:hypothetical protein
MLQLLESSSTKTERAFDDRFKASFLDVEDSIRSAFWKQTGQESDSFRSVPWNNLIMDTEPGVNGSDVGVSNS